MLLGKPPFYTNLNLEKLSQPFLPLVSTLDKLDLRGQKIKQHTHANMCFVVVLFLERTESTDV